MIQNIQNACQTYYNQIPEDSLRCVCKSAAYSFVLSFVLTHNVKQATLNLTRPVASAAVCALASSINALTSPLFKWMFGNNNGLQEIIKFYVDIILTHVLASYATSNKISLFTPLPHQLNPNIMSLNFIKGVLNALLTAAEFFGFDMEPHRHFYENWGINLRRFTPAIYWVSPGFNVI